MNDQAFQTLLFGGSAVTGVVGFLVSQLFSNNSGKHDKNEENLKSMIKEMMDLRIHSEKTSISLVNVEKEMREIKEDARQAVVLGKNFTELQENNVKLRQSLEAAWRNIEELKLIKEDYLRIKKDFEDYKRATDELRIYMEPKKVTRR